MMNNIATALYADGTGSSSKEIGGLQLLVADDPTTGTVGGINRATATNSFWRNITYDATTDGGAAASSANIQSYMNQIWVQLVRGSDRPDLIVADNTYWRLYLESLQAIQRVTRVPQLEEALAKTAEREKEEAKRRDGNPAKGTEAGK